MQTGKRSIPVVAFTFLGFEFRPRESQNYKGRIFLNFLPAISQKAKKKLGDSIRAMKIQRYSTRSIEDLAVKINRIVRGVMNYYGIFYKSAMYGILFRIDYLLRKWSMKKHKSGMKASERWFRKLYKESRELFVHWKYITPRYAKHLAAE
jgi:hypothetical protein